MNEFSNYDLKNKSLNQSSIIDVKEEIFTTDVQLFKTNSKRIDSIFL